MYKFKQKQTLMSKMKENFSLSHGLITFLILLMTLLPTALTQAHPHPKVYVDELELKQVTVQDAIRIISELTGVNIIATNEASEKRFTLFLRDATVSEIIDSISRVAGLWHRHSEKTGVYVMMTTEEYFKDIIVFREETTRIFTLRYQNVSKAAQTIAAMFGRDRVLLDLQEDFTDELQIVTDWQIGSTGSAQGAGTGMGRRNAGGSRTGNRFGQTGRSQIATSSGRRGGVDNIKSELEGMTSEQIVLLEQAQLLKGNTPILLSETVLASVRRQTSVPIFVSVNQEHNLLLIRTSDEKAMKEIEYIIEQSDRPTPQVLLEMKVMSIQLDDGFQSAFDFSYGSGSSSTGPADGQPPNPLVPAAATGPEQILGLLGSPLQANNSLIFQLMDTHVRARLQMLETEGRINILATPMLLASNNRPAKIFIGEQQVMTVGFESGVSGAADVGGGNNNIFATPVPETEVVEIGNTLTILPGINSDRTVLMRLKQESSRLNVNSGSIPVVTGSTVSIVPIDTIGKSSMEGTVMAKDGLTVVVGGMITDTRTDSEEKVPILGDIPLLGALFRKTVKINKKVELVLLITPHVFITPEEAEAVTRQRLSELTAHPNAINIYLDKLDNARQETEQGQMIARAVMQASLPSQVSAGSRLEQNYVQLTSFASEQIRLPAYARESANGIHPVRFSTGTGSAYLFPGNDVESVPLASWSNGALFVTALKVKNLSDEQTMLDENSISGNWLAAALELRQLAASGQSDDTTYLYVISENPFNRSVSNMQ